MPQVVTSKETIRLFQKVVPSFWGGSADLSASNNTMVAAEKISNLVNTKAVIFGLVFANLQWLQQ